MPFSEDDKALIKNTIAQRSWFTKVISRISYKKNLDERQAWYTAEGSEGNWKHWPNLTLRFNSVFAPERANKWEITVSQGSAAMSLRCGGICNNHFVANFVLSRAVKEFWKSINISRSYQHDYRSCFLTQGVYTKYKRNRSICGWVIDIYYSIFVGFRGTAIPE